jgi:hypothetical protein
MIEIRPKDLALFLLASGETLPRRRARDQQADITGLELKRRVLNLLIAIDPEPDELEATLAQIIEELGPPHGPTRAICTIIRDDWEAATLTPELTEWLLDQALRASEHTPEREGRRGKRFDR